MTDNIPPFFGFGLGLRSDHYDQFVDGDASAAVDFVEIVSENYMVDGGKPLYVLDQIRAKLPVIMHGVSMSIGSAEGLDADYLERLKMLVDRVEPLWVSDHLCWTRTSAHNTHDLLPLSYTAEALDVVCDNIDYAQNVLGRAILLENPSSYLAFPEDEMTEWAFIAAMAQRSGCYLLLDVNNVYVSAGNHGYSAMEFLRGIPMERVRQIHLAGHTPASGPGAIAIDTHDRPVCDDVWALYAKARGMLAEADIPVGTMIERDDAIPPLAELLAELGRARDIAADAVCENAFA